MSGHRDVTFKPAREGLKEGKQMLVVQKFTVQFLSNGKANHFNNLSEAADVIIQSINNVILA